MTKTFYRGYRAKAARKMYVSTQTPERSSTGFSCSFLSEATWECSICNSELLGHMWNIFPQVSLFESQALQILRGLVT